ncbi:hypothetical protein HDU76_007464, partial [Blyttiomyces sp. JEL0837]
MTLYVKTLTGKTLVLNDITLLYTVDCLKYLIQDLEGTPHRMQRLIYEGMQCEDGRRLDCYDVED